MTKRLELIFENEMGGNVTLTLDNPVYPANPVVISSAMDSIVAQNVFTSTGGEIKAKKAARIVDRTVEVIDI
ncbi:DUF2922 domain-containing protein [Halalkalibacter akibai]|uniref:DUF2922 domain-containing protein n=1 Tax=Halalkalibacter akibai (strain ATCC 43226 / DSM 21942 / CIP 109018 / JCM 9157 / 1139) TaxID=1236973 RepID=W4QP47_HALA3|nr:DUF2922 domain-containing protein [Halalkalibacter akibai]GAE33682.1 hypothetical protein JCM9157_703 [Halalkalibacter akibai JCM 9157]